MTILTVTYAFARCGRDSVGGAEQIASALDRAIVTAGMRSIVIGAAGSQTAGELISVAVPDGAIGPDVMAQIHTEQRSAIRRVLRSEAVDLVHMHGLDFEPLLPDAPTPVLVTLHLPLAWYSAAALRPARQNTHLNCVSAAQHKARPADAEFLPPIENGVPIDRLMYRRRRGSYVVSLGRICEEKGYHFGVQAARLAGVNMIIAGRIFPYAAHETYFARKLAPLLDARRRFIGAADFTTKRRLLAYARCLLVCSTAPETSSLVAMEALASGTPVIAFRVGALPDIVDHGRTGYLVDTVDEMAEAIRAAERIDRAACRKAAELRFTDYRMTAEYLALYAHLAGHVTTTAGTFV